MIGSWLGRLVLSLFVGFAGAVFLGPACASVAAAQSFEPPPPGDLLGDLTAMIVAAVIVAMAVEVLRLFVPAWKRTADMTDGSKALLRLAALLLGLGSGLLGWAPEVGDGSAPRVFGGVGAGLVAALYGGLLVGAVRRRLQAVYSSQKGGASS